jgi:sugar phosphate isomerase/epimerase
VTLPLAATTFGFLYSDSLDDALCRIAEAGYRDVELALGPPHFDIWNGASEARHGLRRQLEHHGLRCVSTNPLELNPVTANRELFDVSCRQYAAAIELSAEVGARFVVVVAGRRSPLIPLPMAEAKGLLRAQLEQLLPLAQNEGVTLALEPVPYGFIETAADAAAAVRELGAGSSLGLTVDCANVFVTGADPAEQVRAAGGLVRLAHVSDTWRSRWAHTQVGHAEVDLAAFAAALREVGFAGPTVYELADGEDPAPRLQDDLSRLAEWGWAP